MSKHNTLRDHSSTAKILIPSALFILALIIVLTAIFTIHKKSGIQDDTSESSQKNISVPENSHDKASADLASSKAADEINSIQRIKVIDASGKLLSEYTDSDSILHYFDAIKNGREITAGADNGISPVTVTITSRDFDVSYKFYMEPDHPENCRFVSEKGKTYLIDKKDADILLQKSEFSCKNKIEQDIQPPILSVNYRTNGKLSKNPVNGIGVQGNSTYSSMSENDEPLTIVYPGKNAKDLSFTLHSPIRSCTRTRSADAL